MASRKGPSAPSATEDRFVELERKILALQDTVRMLEARVRVLNAQNRQGDEQAAAAQQLRAARTRPKARCPGCTLELPKGRRGDSCVWCGFMFSAVRMVPVRAGSGRGRGR